MTHPTKLKHSILVSAVPALFLLGIGWIPHLAELHTTS